LFITFPRVKRDADAFFVQLLQGFDGILMIERAVFGELDLDAFRRQIGLAQRVFDRFQQKH